MDNIGKNDVVVAKEMGYLRATTEANTKNIEKFYELLSSHMMKEEKERKAMDNKLSLLFVGMVWLAVKDTTSSGWFGGILKSVFPWLPI